MNPITKTVIDRNNFSLFGHARKDKMNGVQQFSSQVGRSPFNNEQDRQTHQKALLNARLKEFKEALKTPSHTRTLQLGPFKSPYTSIWLPSFTDMRLGATRLSYNELITRKKIIQDFLRSDVEVRNAFIEELKPHELGPQLSKEIQECVQDRLFTAYHESKLTKLRDKLRLYGKQASKIRDITTLEKKIEVKTKSTFWESLTVRKSTLERKLAGLKAPSDYEYHLADKNTRKVTNKPLYVGNITPTKENIKAYTLENIKKLSANIRQLHEAIAIDPNSDDRNMYQAKLRLQALEILRSGDRHTLHRFIRDMARQIKRAGYQDNYEALMKLIPEKPSLVISIVQSIRRGTGKQMRLQDKAERMADALMAMTLLTSRQDNKLNELRNTLCHNFFHEDFSGPQSLFDYCQADQPEAHDQKKAVDFLLTDEGKFFIKSIPIHKNIPENSGQQKLIFAMIDKIDTTKPLDKQTNVEYDALLSTVKNFMINANYEIEESPTTSQGSVGTTSESIGTSTNNANTHIINVVPKENNDKIYFLLNHFVNKHRHLFTRTSDMEFWERESIEKIATKLSDTSRTFKQMHLRAALLGINERNINGIMNDGIKSTLLNRNMFVQGSKIGAFLGAAAGHAASAPTSAALSTIIGNPAVIAVPLDPILIPAAYTAGALPGALLAGPVLAYLKSSRLRELSENNQSEKMHQFINPTPHLLTNSKNEANPESNSSEDEAVSNANSSRGATSSTYLSSERHLFSNKTGQARQTTKPSTIGFASQSLGHEIKRTHVPFLKKAGGELIFGALQASKFAFYKGWRWMAEDLILHRSLKKKPVVEQQPAAPAA